MDKNIFKENLLSRRLLSYGRLFMILSKIGRGEDKERNSYLGRNLLWKGRVLRRNEKRKLRRRKRENISSRDECQILQFPSIKESA